MIFLTSKNFYFADIKEKYEVNKFRSKKRVTYFFNSYYMHTVIIQMVQKDIL